MFFSRIFQYVQPANINRLFISYGVDFMGGSVQFILSFKRNLYSIKHIYS